MFRKIISPLSSEITANVVSFIIVIPSRFSAFSVKLFNTSPSNEINYILLVSLLTVHKFFYYMIKLNQKAQ